MVEGLAPSLFLAAIKNVAKKKKLVSGNHMSSKAFFSAVAKSVFGVQTVQNCVWLLPVLSFIVIYTEIQMEICAAVCPAQEKKYSLAAGSSV